MRFTDQGRIVPREVLRMICDEGKRLGLRKTVAVMAHDLEKAAIRIEASGILGASMCNAVVFVPDYEVNRVGLEAALRCAIPFVTRDLAAAAGLRVDDVDLVPMPTDPVVMAVELVGFRPHEVDSARVYAEDGCGWLEVTLVGTDWQPAYDLTAIELWVYGHSDVQAEAAKQRAEALILELSGWDSLWFAKQSAKGVPASRPAERYMILMPRRAGKSNALAALTGLTD